MMRKVAVALFFSCALFAQTKGYEVYKNKCASCYTEAMKKQEVLTRYT